MTADASTPDALAIERMRRRVRVFRALRAGLDAAPWSLALATLTLLGARLGTLSMGAARVGFGVSLALPVMASAAGALRRVTPLFAAQLLDRHYRLHDRLSTALEFRAKAPEARDAWMDAAIADAESVARATDLDARKALAWRWPAELRYAGALLAVLAVTGLAEFRVARVVNRPRPTAARIDPAVLTDDDLQAFRELSRELARTAATPASRETVRSFDRLLDDLAGRRLDRQEAFRRLAALQQTIDDNAREDRDALRERLGDMGRRMGDNPQTRELSQALRDGDLQRARDAMARMAEQLRQERALSQQQREEMARALARAAEQRNDGELQRRLEQARREVDEMLRRQRERALSNNEQDLLRRRQRETERLTREQERNEALRRQVEHLQRELSETARNLPQSPPQAADHAQQGAEELSRMRDEQQGQQSLDELRQRLEELREQMRQQNGQNGQRQRQRVAQFSRAAMGRGSQQGGSQQGGSQAGGSQQGGSQAGGSQQGGSQAGGSQPGGQGGSQPGGSQPGGQGGSQPVMAGVQQGVAQSSATVGTGGGAGVGHDDNARGAAVQTQQTNAVVQVNGQQTGNGPSRSAVIRTAAADGFASAPYRQVYAPYWDHAREVLHQGEVPAGYRSYVRRYFQLIRPREESTP